MTQLKSLLKKTSSRSEELLETGWDLRQLQIHCDNFWWESAHTVYNICTPYQHTQKLDLDLFGIFWPSLSLFLHL